MNTPMYDDIGNFIGFRNRDCGEHRTVGDYRAWCHDCTEWCYPHMPCVRCEIVGLRKRNGQLPPNIRSNDHSSSTEGAADVAGRAPNQRMRLLAEYERDDEYNGNGLTDEQAAEYAQLLSSCYWKRCGELRYLQYIEFTGDVRPGAAGTNRKISRITERGRAALRTESEAS